MHFIFIRATDSEHFLFSFGHRQRWDSGEESFSFSLKSLRRSACLVCLMYL